MRKVKIIYDDTRIGSLEEKVNDFLEAENTSIEIIKIQMIQATEEEHACVFIAYEEL